MNIYPAIDIRDGRCVMLMQGDADKETVYSNNPVEVARRWQDMGAKFLHIVDLDGAFQGESRNIEVIMEVIESVSISLQIGGGFRTLKKIELFLEDPKVARVILGTSAVTKPQLLEKAIGIYGDRIAVGIDAKDGQVAIRGWVEKTETDSIEFGKRLYDMGVDTVIYTDIEKDGMLKGPNIEATKAMIDETGLKIIASGGVTSLEDIKLIKGIGAEGVIIGKALYSGAIALGDALAYEGV
ncbi:MAG TPA: 1-(5-phosphoribosyl)-5-[(5-phosphoribosylamino)methylideneamino]imidazole-4-carboxamide isomerase [Clostridia bacterium]|nr:1-(5-phosphoribosyl)-5-[(5-phosphoribosylamino)methylideneamino]imidazole-4-carboxamide isomerase [Clostridia bacterium]